MQGRDLVLAAYRREESPRVPWVPFTGVHAAGLAGYSAQEALHDVDKLVQAALVAHDLYRPDGQPVLFDLQVEAEILGCELRWADDAPPAVVSHPLQLKGYDALGDLAVPTPSEGRLPIALDATRRLVESIGNQTAIYGLITGPFTLASHLRGLDLFLDMFDAPDAVGELMEFCGAVAQRMTELYASAGADVIAVVDPMISQISADHFRHFVAPVAASVMEHIRTCGKAASFFVCGDATEVLAPMAECHPDGISVDENVDLKIARSVAERYGISFAGNIPLTTVMLFGNEVDNMRCVLDLLDAYGGPGYILSPGCDIPFSVPLSNIGALTMAIFDPDNARSIVNNQLRAGAGEELQVQLPDYASLTRPLVEVITIDSETCPPCKYMVDATRQVASLVPGGIDWIEYKITRPENVARMQALGVTNLPTIVINGKAAFVSRIPDLMTYRDTIVEWSKL